MSKSSADRLQQPASSEARDDFARILVHQTVGEALAHVQRSQIAGQVVYFYVVDDAGRLKGVVPARGLLLNPAETPVAQIMLRNVVKLPSDATLLDACETFILHRLLALPIVDAQGRILSVIDVGVFTDEMIDVADRQASEDLFQLIGVRLSQVRQAGVIGMFRYRFPWLLCNLGSGLVCAAIIGVFEGVLQQMLVLALFVPVILALAEGVSIQSLSLTLLAQHGRPALWRTLLRAVARELPIGLLLGIASGFLVGLVAWSWRTTIAGAACMSVSIALAVATAALMGVVVPAAVGTLRRDARVASGPIALALSDVATLVYYFGLAWWWLV